MVERLIKKNYKGIEYFYLLTGVPSSDLEQLYLCNYDVIASSEKLEPYEIVCIMKSFQELYSYCHVYRVSPVDYSGEFYKENIVSDTMFFTNTDIEDLKRMKAEHITSFGELVSG